MAPCDDILALDFKQKSDDVFWLNTYGLNTDWLNNIETFKQVIHQNQWDDFLFNLLQDQDHTNKVIELDNVLFIALKVLKSDDEEFNHEQMIFMVTANMLWSLQENPGGHFQWIRERLLQGKGLVRTKKVDYLIFLIIESLIANYEATLEKLLTNGSDFLSTSSMSNINPTPEFTKQVEKQKRHMLSFKRATFSLRNTIVKLETTELIDIKSKYLTELKEQANNLIDEADFELYELDSKTNLIFSIQGHRLNEIMRTLTVISAVFIPLTFLAGIYGMNFINIPELKFKYGYYVLLAFMAALAFGIIKYFKSKKWF